MCLAKGHMILTQEQLEPLTELNGCHPYSEISSCARIANTGDGRRIMREHHYHLGFVKVMTCGGHYMERHTRFRTLTQTMIFIADLQKGFRPVDKIFTAEVRA
jgi:hypothetical protein